jgi:hypothetical protein
LTYIWVMLYFAWHGSKFWTMEYKKYRPNI